jgi:hypothetical protein
MEVAEYVLQLGYTTNNPFTYEIFPAEESTVSSGNSILEPNGKDYYYTKTSASALSGKYLNLSGTTASNEYHDMTFEGYDSVQTNAEPVYWQSVKITPKEAAKRSDGSFVEYYILKISWPSGSSNNKETDMIYLMTGIV